MAKFVLVPIGHLHKNCDCAKNMPAVYQICVELSANEEDPQGEHAEQLRKHVLFGKTLCAN